jgi:hypothetical protein
VTLAPSLIGKVTSALLARFCVPTSKALLVWKHLPIRVTEWGKIQILPAGDLIRSSKLGEANCGEDARDASFVRVRKLLRHRLWAELKLIFSSV